MLLKIGAFDHSNSYLASNIISKRIIQQRALICVTGTINLPKKEV
jgi:hypothetical protein